jgi:hypothetical protein
MLQTDSRHLLPGREGPLRPPVTRRLFRLSKLGAEPYGKLLVTPNQKTAYPTRSGPRLKRYFARAIKEGGTYTPRFGAGQGWVHPRNDECCDRTRRGDVGCDAGDQSRWGERIRQRRDWLRPCRSSRGPRYSDRNASREQRSTGSRTVAASSKPRARATDSKTPRPAPGARPDPSTKLWTKPLHHANFRRPNCCRFRPFRAAVFDRHSQSGLSLETPWAR